MKASLLRNISKPFYSTGNFGLMLKDVAYDIAKKGVEANEFFRQIVNIGNRSFAIVFLTNIFTGMVLALQTAYGLERFGAKLYVGNIVALAITRELGPVLTAIMLCGRVGSGIAAELASMVVTEQVDAIRALGADPIRKLVSPRILAAILVLPLMSVLADFIGIAGGGLVAIYQLDLTPHTYFNSVVNFVTLRDCFDGLVKASFFGFVLVSISCYAGLTAEGGTEGVGHATTKAVVVGSITILISDFFLTRLLIMI
ncbi:MAG: ABC transporter permease [Candidatus Dadabacteria bacterium]|nr:MAG: ABC transporter permease [Candidatus Dadabacteria bacterium]